MIEYDTYLNKVKKVNWADGRWITFTYNGASELIQRKSSAGDTWDYANGIIYKNNVAYQIPTPEGRIVNNAGSWIYEYEYRDHLGNLRVGYTKESGKLKINQLNTVDPWGFEISALSANNLTKSNFKYQGKEEIKEIGWIDFGARMYDPARGQFTTVDPLAEFLPGINSYAYAINNPILFNDRFGLYPSLANGTNQVAKCETCPNGENYDVYRESKSQFTYIDGMVVNGDGSGPTAYAQRNNNSYNFFYEFGMGSAGTADYFLGKRIENIAKWDGTHRYGGAKNVLSQAEIDAKAIARQPLIKNRPINILRQYALPRKQALKLAKGLKGLGFATAAFTTLETTYKLNHGEISTAHAVGTVAMVAGGLVLATASAPVVISAIIVGGLYGIYEDDIWHDYDKQNATNFKEPDK